MTGRLSIALERGVVALPEGDLLVIGATVESELDSLPMDRTRVLSRFADAHDALRDRGWDCVTEPPLQVDGAVLFLPRARDAQRAGLKLASRLTKGGPIIVDGAKTHGVDAFYREVRDRADVSEAWSKDHGKVFAVTGGQFNDWPRPDARLDADGWWRGPGVFSADGIDKASAMLADALPAQLSGTVIDLGAGWGFLSRAILGRDGVTALDLVENDRVALDAARRNIDDRRATFHWADALNWHPVAPADHVVTNPPFHAGRAADPELGRAFIRAAAEMLKPKGSLWLVANRHLPYESTLEDAFRNVEPLAPNPSFKLFHASSPRRSRKG